MARRSDSDITSTAPNDVTFGPLQPGEPDPDQFPRLKGFRLRGIAPTRLETFIDAAFAFAITMLVIAGNQVPNDVEELLGAFKNVPTFIVCIGILMIFWRGHWIWSRRYGLEDTTSILISWGMLVTILIYVYPLRLMFGALFYYLSGTAIGEHIVVHDPSNARAMFVLYGLGTAIISFEILLLNWHAWRLRDPLRLNKLERWITINELTAWCIPVVVGLLSIILAFTLPMKHINWSGWVYFSMAVLFPLHRRWRDRGMPQ